MDKGSQPNIRDLQRYVIPHVTEKWEDLCIELNFDEDGRVMESIRKDHPNNPKACCRDVLLRWLRGEGEGPRTWGKIVDCLGMIDAKEAVNAVEENVLKTKSCGYYSNISQQQVGSIEKPLTPLEESKIVQYDLATEHLQQSTAHMSKNMVLSKSDQLDSSKQKALQKDAGEEGMDPSDAKNNNMELTSFVTCTSNSSLVHQNNTSSCRLVAIDEGTKSPRHNLLTQNISYKVEKLEPRQYQLELATPGMEGKNCIVCAPTGTGKTFVAALIIAHHLNQKQGKGKVVFVVPTQPLAKQQQNNIKEFIPMARVACCVGDDTGGSIYLALADNEVIVCTAGKLWDELQEMNDRSLKFTHFSLMVIDECHRARKQSPQANVMTKYLKEKIRENNVSLSQVLGLTASPGAGEGKVPRFDNTYEHLLSLCALMDATEGIVTVQKHRDELEKHTKKSTSTLKHYPGRNPGNEKFIQTTLEVMKEWEKVVNIKTSFDRWDQRYETIIRQRKRELEECPTPMRGDISVLEYLLCLTLTLSAYMKLRHEDALSVLKEFTFVSSGTGSMEAEIIQSIDSLMKTLSTLSPVPNPLLEQVKDVLITRFFENKSSRAILFACTKKQAACIFDWISKLPSEYHLKPRIVVGHTADTGPGMTDPEKAEALAGFREGKYNILVATSVLEEGIDIPACNLVIRYEHVTNEIAKVQAEGRARAENSEGITIVSDSSNKIYQELLNEEKDQIVKEAIEYLPCGIELRKKINEKQMHIIQKEEMKLWVDEQRQNSVKESELHKVIMKCKKCKVFVCKGSDLYTLQQNGYQIAVPDKRFREEKSRTRPYSHPCVRKGFNPKEKIYCMNCDSDWGVVSVWMHIEFPLLSCKAFNFEIDGVPTAVSQWSKAPFKIPPIHVLPEFRNVHDDSEQDI